MSSSPLSKLTSVETEINAHIQDACKDVKLLNSTGVLPENSKILSWVDQCDFAGASALSLVLTIIRDTAVKRVADAKSINSLAYELADAFLSDMKSSSVADHYPEAFEELKEYREDMVTTFIKVMERYRVQ